MPDTLVSHQSYDGILAFEDLQVNFSDFRRQEALIY